MRRLGQVATGALAALLVVGAVPAVLVVFVGVPLPRHDGHLDLASARALFDALAVVAWVAWATGCVALLRAVAALVRDPGALAGAAGSLPHRLAAAVAVSVLAAISLAGTPADVRLPPAAHRAGASSALTRPGTWGRTDPGARAPGAWRVREGDSLWHIAECAGDDGGQWPTLAAANRDRLMPDGRRFVDPNHLRPGWVLVGFDHAGEDGALPDRRSDARRPGPAVPLPELIALGLSTVAASALARHLRRRQLLTRSARIESLGTEEPASAPVELPVDMATLVHPFASATALDWLVWGNRRLAQLVADGRDTTPLPRLVQVGPDGLELDFAEATPGAPPGVAVDGDGHRWRLAFEDRLAGDAALDGGPVWLPLLMPLGDDDRGTWLAVAGPGRCLPVLGRGAEGLVAAMRVALAAWPWADQLRVSDHAPTIEAATAGRAEPGALGAAQHLFVGDPTQLSADALERCAVLSNNWSARADLTVVADERATTVHPLGLVIGPSGLPAPIEGDAEGLRDRPPAAPARRLVGHEQTTDAAAVDVRVRLLTAQPRLEGLAEALPANRERRATELVAYLALHRGEAVSSDRLRTRVFGSGEADAAAKTLFNIAAAARRALGEDAAGTPLLPAALRSGYRVSESVRIDVEEADRLVDQGLAARAEGRGPAAMASLRAALALVEAEPLSAVVAGYGWFAAEGHEGRLAARLVDAACHLAELGGAAGHRDLAEWGLRQARRVEPYSEALSRAAMRLAAAAGDSDGVRREWRDCQRRADDLDPGSTPSAGTERLYAELIERSSGRSA